MPELQWNTIGTARIYTDVTDDSLARIAVEYYRDRKDPGKKAQSWYYFGRVQQNAGDWIPATVSFTNAGKYADESGDCFLEGLVYRSMAEINSVTLNYPEELHYSSLAYEKFSAAGADKYRDYVLLYIAMAYNNSMDFANCESVCRTLRPIAEQYRDTALLAGCLLTYASALVFKESPEPEKAIEQITFVQDSLLVPLSLPDYGNLARERQGGQGETLLHRISYGRTVRELSGSLCQSQDIGPSSGFTLPPDHVAVSDGCAAGSPACPVGE